MTKAVKVRELRHTDAPSLLAFETHNRVWFESHIDPRAPAFYSMPGVTEHIEQCLTGLAAGTWHAFVMEDAHGNILGRANLKSIDLALGSAEVGYRIAQDACGQGLATQALTHLILSAHERWGLTQLVAFVYERNSGSKKVLARCGFVADRTHHDEGTQNVECRFILHPLPTIADSPE